MSQVPDLYPTMVQLVSGGLDLGRLNQTHEDAVQVIQACVNALKATDIRTEGLATCPQCDHRFVVKGLDITKVSKVVADMGKFMDLTKRLQEFMAGRPDSRPGGDASAWLTKLTADQFEQVCRWVSEADRTPA